MGIVLVLVHNYCLELCYCQMLVRVSKGLGFVLAKGVLFNMTVIMILGKLVMFYFKQIKNIYKIYKI